MSRTAQAREKRVARKLDARGCKGLGSALVRFRGVRFGGNWELSSLYAVGAEGAVFLCRDIRETGPVSHVAKIALIPYHKPFEMSFGEVRRRRDLLRDEAQRLEASASRYMPAFFGAHELSNPLLDPRRGGEYALPEPVFVMERLPGFDLDTWLARVHASRVPRVIVRRNVDHVAIVVLRGLWDLHERGFFYCDLRPGNVRIRGRSEHRVRLMDAGSLVPRDDPSISFPHVPAYLPPELYRRAEQEGSDALVPSLSVQAIMAGRTLFEVATGRMPMPGVEVDAALLRCHTVSPEIADTIEGLCAGAFDDVFEALNFLAKRTSKGSVTSSPDAPELSRTIVAPTARSARPAPPSIDLAGALAAARANFSPPPAVGPVRRPPLAVPSASTATAAIADQRVAAAAAAATPAPDVEEPILPPSRPKSEPMWRSLLRRLRVVR